MMGDPRTIGACAHLLFVAKNLERIGDYATGIAEIIHYEVTGEEIEGDRPSGTVAKPMVGAATKHATMEAALAERGLVRAASLAVGDGANDLPMVQAAGLGVAYRAKPIVAAAAAARIDHGDLSALLYAQGIPRAEWVTG